MATHRVGYIAGKGNNTFVGRSSAVELA